jgi:putative transposase
VTPSGVSEVQSDAFRRFFFRAEMYEWRKMSETEREKALTERKARRLPWHAPPHFEYAGEQRFIISATCFEHQPIIGASAERMAECESALIEICDDLSARLYAWCVLPNHYHLLIKTDELEKFLYRIGKFHGSSAYLWNGQDDARGRKVWFRAVERSMRSVRHYFASLNYIHHNPVKHGYTEKSQEWPYSSAAEYLERVGKDKALGIWQEYPIFDYGKGWDD